MTLNFKIDFFFVQFILNLFDAFDDNKANKSTFKKIHVFMMTSNAIFKEIMKLDRVGRKYRCTFFEFFLVLTCSN